MTGRTAMFEAGDIRQRRAELNMWRSELAAKVGVDRRQIRRYESGEAQPTLPIAKAIASALGITIDELAAEDTHRINLTGDWWACWRTWKDGTEVLNCHQISIQQQGGKQRVEKLPAQGADDPFADGVGSWRLRRADKNRDAFRGEPSVEGAGELACAVPDQEPD